MTAVDWQTYDAFDWTGARQSPMAPAERAAVAELVADLLGLAPADRESDRGQASPPGR